MFFMCCISICNISCNLAIWPQLWKEIWMNEWNPTTPVIVTDHIYLQEVSEELWRLRLAYWSISRCSLWAVQSGVGEYSTTMASSICSTTTSISINHHLEQVARQWKWFQMPVVTKIRKYRHLYPWTYQETAPEIANQQALLHFQPWDSHDPVIPLLLDLDLSHLSFPDPIGSPWGVLQAVHNCTRRGMETGITTAKRGSYSGEWSRVNPQDHGNVHVDRWQILLIISFGNHLVALLQFFTI